MDQEYSETTGLNFYVIRTHGIGEKIHGISRVRQNNPVFRIVLAWNRPLQLHTVALTRTFNGRLTGRNVENCARYSFKYVSGGRCRWDRREQTKNKCHQSLVYEDRAAVVFPASAERHLRKRVAHIYCLRKCRLPENRRKTLRIDRRKSAWRQFQNINRQIRHGTVVQGFFRLGFPRSTFAQGTKFCHPFFFSRTKTKPRVTKLSNTHWLSWGTFKVVDKSPNRSQLVLSADSTVVLHNYIHGM